MRILLAGILIMFLLSGCNENDGSCIAEEKCVGKKESAYDELAIPVDRSESKEY